MRGDWQAFVFGLVLLIPWVASFVLIMREDGDQDGDHRLR